MEETRLELLLGTIWLAHENASHESNSSWTPCCQRVLFTNTVHPKLFAVKLIPEILASGALV